MREKFNQLIESCGPRTVPAAETKSIGLAAYAQVSWFLLSHLDSFIMTRQLSSIYRDLVPSRQIIMTRDFSTIYRDLQKPRHRDTDGNSPNRRAVSGHGRTYDIIFDTLGKSPFSGCVKSLTNKGIYLRADHMSLAPVIHGLLNKSQLSLFVDQRLSPNLREK